MNNYIINNKENYDLAYAESTENPVKFWDDIASKNFVWEKKWSSVVNWNFDKAEIKWFENSKLNITVNCIDRHVKENPDKIAILFEIPRKTKILKYKSF